MASTVAPFAGAWIEIQQKASLTRWIVVAPFAGAWIEIKKRKVIMLIRTVAPFAGAWIEIPIFAHVKVLFRSLPSRERGLKYEGDLLYLTVGESLPSRERGLKSCLEAVTGQMARVAPFAGAWIEIMQNKKPDAIRSRSLPSRERGLKFYLD